MKSLIVMSLLSLCACTHGKVMDTESETVITSDPPGAGIEVNEGYVGVTPVTVTLSRYDKGMYITNYTPVSVTALPNEKGQCRQFKSISGEQRLPGHIHFVMGLCPRFTY